ncbi:MAG: hypothetical protein AB7O52_01515 [Planctomycetota bacterium]
MTSRIGHLLRVAATVCVVSGLVGGWVWGVDLIDRSDGDSLRGGFWRNPFMAFAPFSVVYLDISMWVLLACSAAVGVGGLLLWVPHRWAVPLVTWQARVSIATNGVIVVFISLMALGVLPMQWTGKALALRVGSMVVDLALLTFLSSNAVTRHFGVAERRPPGSAAKPGPRIQPPRHRARDIGPSSRRGAE